MEELTMPKSPENTKYAWDWIPMIIEWLGDITEKINEIVRWINQKGSL